MIQFNISKALAKPLGKFIKPAKHSEGGLIWRADIAQIGLKSCVVLEEQNSRYVMVLCGLKKGDFANFPNVFQQRFWRESAAICKRLALYDTSTLAKYLQMVGQVQRYQLDTEPMEQGRIVEVKDELERRFLRQPDLLPVDGKSAFEFAFSINNRKPTSDQMAGVSAVEALAEICLNLIEVAMEQETSYASRNRIAACGDNVVRVDFSRWE